jgi:hypothetical protein
MNSVPPQNASHTFSRISTEDEESLGAELMPRPGLSRQDETQREIHSHSPHHHKHNIDKEPAEMAAYGYVMKLASEVEPKLAQVGKKAKGSSEHDDDSADEGSAPKLGGATQKCKAWGRGVHFPEYHYQRAIVI